MRDDRIAWKMLLRGAGLMAAACGYARLARPRMARWGATDGEVAGAMPGDGEVPEPQFAVTRAVTIAAPPGAVWPWIVQIGYHRAGWYAHDLFDNDDIPSAEAILPEFQHLETGQVIGEEGFAVRELEPGRHLVLGFHYPKTEWVVKQGAWPKFGHCSMCLQLKPVHDGERTRLLYRVRLSAPPLGRAVMAAFFEPTRCSGRCVRCAKGIVEFRRGRGVTVTGLAPQRSAVMAKARELVVLARRYGYRPDEVADIIQQLL